MKIRDFTREEIPKAIVKWLSNQPDDISLADICYEIESGNWLHDLEKDCEGWK